LVADRVRLRAWGILHVGSHLILIPYRYAFWRYQISVLTMWF
jgi:membrane protein YdbS with pleckstrin-like domain